MDACQIHGKACKNNIFDLFPLLEKQMGQPNGGPRPHAFHARKQLFLVDECDATAEQRRRQEDFNDVIITNMAEDCFTGSEIKGIRDVYQVIVVKRDILERVGYPSQTNGKQFYSNDDPSARYRVFTRYLPCNCGDCIRHAYHKCKFKENFGGLTEQNVKIKWPQTPPVAQRLNSIASAETQTAGPTSALPASVRPAKLQAFFSSSIGQASGKDHPVLVILGSNIPDQSFFMGLMSAANPKKLSQPEMVDKTLEDGTVESITFPVNDVIMKCQLLERFDSPTGETLWFLPVKAAYVSVSLTTMVIMPEGYDSCGLNRTNYLPYSRKSHFFQHNRSTKERQAFILTEESLERLVMPC